jgi:hypothetical protein
MKLIAHRGNVNGSNCLEENNPEYIEDAILKGFDVEIDLRYNSTDNTFYLGHDEPQYIIDKFWLEKYKNYLWIHCKNIESLFEFTYGTSGFNYFWHQEDDFTLTSKNYIWTYPGKPYTPMSVIVMPEWNKNPNQIGELKLFDCYAICSDYVENLNVQK